MHAPVTGQCLANKIVQDLTATGRANVMVESAPGQYEFLDIATFRGTIVSQTDLGSGLPGGTVPEPVPGARVDVTLTGPDGSIDRTLTANSRGEFVATLSSKDEGTFSIRVNKITCPDGSHQFDSEATAEIGITASPLAQ